MGRLADRRVLSIFMLTIFIFSAYSPIATNQSEAHNLLGSDNYQASSSNENIVSIGSYPSSIVSNASIMVPSGKAVTGIDLSFEGNSLPNHVAYSIETDNDFKSSQLQENISVEQDKIELINIPPTVINVFGTNFSYGSGPFGDGSESWEYTYTHSSGSFYLQYDCTLGGTASSFGAPYCSETRVDYKTPGAANFRTWKPTGSMSNNVVYDSINDSPPLVFTSPGVYRFKLYDSFGDGSNGGGVGIIQEEYSDFGFWQSNPISLSSLGINEDMALGPMTIDAKIPGDSKVTMSIIDATTNITIPGMEEIEAKYFDLGVIDWELYPEVMIKLELTASASGDSPIIYGLHFEGKIADSLETDVSGDWILQSSSWSSGRISGSGSAISPEYVSRSGFSIIKTNSLISGGGKIQYSLDSGQSWMDFDSSNTAIMTQPYFDVKFKISGSNNWVLDYFSVELLRTSVARGVAIDIEADGVAEWSMKHDGSGKMGVQDRFIENSLSQVKQNEIGPAEFGLLLPRGGINSLEFYCSSINGSLLSPYFVFSIGSQDLFTKSLPDISSIHKIRLTEVDINQVNNALLQGTTFIESNGYSMVEVVIKIGSSSSTSDIQLNGLHATYNPTIDLSFDQESLLVKRINSLIPKLTYSQGDVDVAIPISMTGTGSIKLNIQSVDTIQSITPTSIEVSNVTDTFTPSMQWIDVTSSFDFSGIGVSNPESFVKAGSWLVDFNMVGQNNAAQLRCSTLALPIIGNGVSNCIQSGVELIWSDLGTNGAISMSGSSSTLEFHHRFKFPVEWDDEEFLSVSVNMVSTTGPMLSVSKSFGLGYSQGVENDVSLKHWSVIGANGIPSDNEYPYLQSQRGEPVVVQAQLGFEGNEGTAPRTGHALVRLLVNGNEYGATSIINDGFASIPWVIPTVGETVELEIDIQPLRGQSVLYEVQNVIEFSYDSVNPQLISMNIDEFDHFPSNPSTILEFTITDRPLLPTQAEIVLWNSWEHDFNQNGQIDLAEVTRNKLELPDYLTYLEGIYTYDLDSSNAPDGGYVRGWIEVADSAGNVLADSGNISHPLFNLLISSDGSPQLGYSELAWDYGYLPWLHPGEDITLTIPVWDKNGITDITDIEVDLSVNQPDSSSIFWNRQTGVCTSSTLYIQINECRMVGDSGSGLFTNSGNFEIDFQLKWGFDPDDSIVRTPLVRLTDLNRQSTTLELSDLDWKYSGEMAIDENSLEYFTSGNTDSVTGSWVKAREEISVSGSLTWAKTHRSVNQDLELLFTLGLNQAQVEYRDGAFNGTIISPSTPGNYPIDISLKNPPNGAAIVDPYSPLLWFIVDDEIPSIKSIDYPLPAQIIEEKEWDSFEILMTLEEDNFLDIDSLNLKWEVHPSGFGFASSSIANGTGKIGILGGMPFGESISGIFDIDLDNAVSEELRTEALELRIWINGSDMAGNSFGSISDEIYTPFAIWQLEQQLPDYSLVQPSISYSGKLSVGKSVDLSVVIKNVGKSDGDAQLRVERVESNGARTIIHTQEVKVNSGGSGVFNHRWTPDRDGSMWIEFIIVGGSVTQTDTFYVDDGSSDGFFGGISEMNPVLLIIIFLLIASLIGILIFGLRTPKQVQHQRLPPNKNYQAVNRQMRPQQNHQYAQQQAPNSPGDNPYQ